MVVLSVEVVEKASRIPKDHRTVRVIANAYRSDESRGYVVHGPRGVGKTVYTVIIGSQLIGTVAEPEWGEPTRRWIKFTPKEFTEIIQKVSNTQIWFDWDDAGYWLNRLFWYDDFVKESLRYMTLQRTQFTSIFFSTPSLSMLPGKVLELPDVYRVRISKTQENCRDTTNRKRPREAMIVAPWHSDYNSKSGCRWMYDELFNGIFPDAFFEWYQPLRKTYTTMAAANIKAALERSRGTTMRMELEEVLEDLTHTGIMPDADRVKELSEVVDQHASYKEQEKINLDRKESKRRLKNKSKMFIEDQYARTVEAFEEDTKNVELDS